MVESLARRSPICWSMSDTGPRSEQSDSNLEPLERRGGLRSREVEVCAVGRGALTVGREELAWNRITEVGSEGADSAAEGDVAVVGALLWLGLTGTCRTFGTL